MERRRFLFASVTDDFWVDAFVDEVFRKVYVDDENMIKIVEAMLVTMPDVIDDEVAVGSTLAFVQSPQSYHGLVRVFDVTEPNAGYGHWMDGIENPDGSIGVRR